MTHVSIPEETDFATRCWVCGECVPASFYRTQKNGRWILFIQPCGNCFKDYPVGGGPKIKDRQDYPSSGPPRTEGQPHMLTTDTWFTPDVGRGKYYGTFPQGLLERLREKMGASIDDPVLHVCGGMVRDHKGFGPNDKTMDLNPAVNPDYFQDARDPYPEGFRFILADPPHTMGDMQQYPIDQTAFPLPSIILQRANEALLKGGMVAVGGWSMPDFPEGLIPVSVITVITNSRFHARLYTIFEKV